MTELNQASAAPVSVLIYAGNEQNYPQRDVIRLNATGSITATGTNSLSDITATNLAMYDVFYATTCFHNNLNSKAHVLEEFLMDGGGIVVGQANRVGAIDWLPAGLEAIVADRGYPNARYFALTSLGLSHPIFEGLDASDLGERPSDTIYASSVGPDWDVLMVYGPQPDLLGLAAGTLGQGRILLWPVNITSDMHANPSLQFLRQAFEWVAVPEPSSILLLAFGGLLCLRRWR